MKDKVTALIDIFNKAYDILQYALDNPENEFVRNSAFEKFEFTSELFLKTIWLYVELEGKKTSTVESCLLEAKNLDIIEDENIYFTIFREKKYLQNVFFNDTNNDYYKKINDYSVFMKKTIDRLYSHL